MDSLYTASSLILKHIGIYSVKILDQDCLSGCNHFLNIYIYSKKAVRLTSHLFTPVFMFIHLKLILLVYWLTSNITGNCLPIFVSYYISLCICYCFSHLIDLFSVTWLSLLYKFTQLLIYFPFLSEEGPTLEILDFTIRIGPIGSTPTFLYISKNTKDWLFIGDWFLLHIL